MFKSEEELIKKFVVFCNRCKLKTIVLARSEHTIKTYWVCRCGSSNFTILGEERR